MKFKFKNKDKGFALLFSVLISSLLLTIGLSIFSITLKELAISTAARQSIHAFFAADSGREYALYKDVKEGSISIIDPNNSAQQDPPPVTIGELTVISGGSATDTANFRVDIVKHKDAGASSPIETTITSYGYDSEDDDRVERAIEQSY